MLCFILSVSQEETSAFCFWFLHVFCSCDSMWPKLWVTPLTLQILNMNDLGWQQCIIWLDHNIVRNTRRVLTSTCVILRIWFTLSAVAIICLHRFTDTPIWSGGIIKYTLHQPPVKYLSVHNFKYFFFFLHKLIQEHPYVQYRTCGSWKALFHLMIKCHPPAVFFCTTQEGQMHFFFSFKTASLNELAA